MDTHYFIGLFLPDFVVNQFDATQYTTTETVIDIYLDEENYQEWFLRNNADEYVL